MLGYKRETMKFYHTEDRPRLAAQESRSATSS